MPTDESRIGIYRLYVFYITVKDIGPLSVAGRVAFRSSCGYGRFMQAAWTAVLTKSGWQVVKLKKCRGTSRLSVPRKNALAQRVGVLLDEFHQFKARYAARSPIRRRDLSYLSQPN